jgi:hypothetical protein
MECNVQSFCKGPQALSVAAATAIRKSGMVSKQRATCIALTGVSSFLCMLQRLKACWFEFSKNIQFSKKQNSKLKLAASCMCGMCRLATRKDGQQR